MLLRLTAALSAICVVCSVDASSQSATKDRGALTSQFYVSANTQTTDTATFALRGGAFKSYGCKAIEPTYWMSGGCCEVVVTFTQPANMPAIRVWGMNTDDSASVKVNGMPYVMSDTTAQFLPKVVCGTSPGPNGVAFANGLLVGANTPSEGNYSYQDIVLYATSVSTITVTALKGAGWGFAGVSVYRRAEVQERVKDQDTKKAAEPDRR